MSEKFPQLSPKHIEFIVQQHIFFVGTAAADGRVNVSPKGLDTLKVDGPNKVLWLNLTGSGNETAAHVHEHERMTLMFCSFGPQPLILRLYGRARVVHEYDAQWQVYSSLYENYTGARQIFELDIDMVQTSCGFAVPMMEFQSERDTLIKWASNRGREAVKDYWQEKNQTSIDGKPIHILKP